MTISTDSMKLTIQDTLDELFTQHLIPFELTAQRVNVHGYGEYTVPFYDSRIHSVTFSWKGESSLKEVIRSAVLERVKEMSGPSAEFRMTTSAW